MVRQLFLSAGGRRALLSFGALACAAVLACLVFVPFTQAGIVMTTRASMAYLCAHAAGGFESFTPPAVATYPDVPTDHPVYAEIEYVFTIELMVGYPDGYFRPEFLVMRSHAAVWIARIAAGGDAFVPEGPATPTFPDVPVTHWAYKWIEYLVSLGVPVDYGDGTFHPTEAIDFFDAADWLYYATGTYVDPNGIPPGGGTIQGIVYDDYWGSPIEGAGVMACDGWEYYETATSLDGSFAMYGVALSADYMVCAGADGYVDEEVPGVPVGPGTVQTLYMGMTMYTPPPPIVGSATMYCPDWHIELNDAGYSDWMIMTYPHQQWHENLSGEWAAAVRYDGIGTPDGESMWLSPYFLYPSFYTATDLETLIPISTWDDPENPTDGADTGYSEIRNADLSIAISYTMYMTDAGTAAGLRPGGVGTRTPATSGRYVLGQTYNITNISGGQLTNVSFYQMLHAHPNDDYDPNNFGVYDPTAYAAGDMSEFCYDITQYGASMWNPPGSDITGFSAAEAPTAWGLGEFPGHSGEPSTGIHIDIYDDTLPMTTSDGPSEIAGAMKWDLGTLEAGASVEKTVLLWNGYYIPQLAPVGRVLSMPTEQLAVPGTTVEVPVNIGEASGMAGLQVRVTFDSSLLEATGASKGDLIAGNAHWLLADPVLSDGSIEVLTYDDTATGLPEGTGSDSMLMLEFQVKPGAALGSMAVLHFDVAVVSDPWGDPLDYTAIDGSLRISSLKPNHLYIYPIESPQVGDAVYPMPFTVAVEARDILGHALLGYAGSLTMYDATETIAPISVGPMVDGYWSGQVTIGTPLADDWILAVDSQFPDVWDESNEFQVIGLGDVNGDDIVNVLDVVKIVNFALEKLVPTPGWQAWVADIDHNSSVDVLDVLLAVNLSLGQPIYSPTYSRLAALPAKAKEKQKPVSVSLVTETNDNATLSEVVLSDASGVAGLQLELEYDDRKLTPVSVELAGLTQAAGDWTIQSNVQDGTMHVLLYNPSLRGLPAGEGIVAVVRFQGEDGKRGKKPALKSAVLGNDRGGEVACTAK